MITDVGNAAASWGKRAKISNRKRAEDPPGSNDAPPRFLSNINTAYLRVFPRRSLSKISQTRSHHPTPGAPTAESLLTLTALRFHNNLLHAPSNDSNDSMHSVQRWVAKAQYTDFVEREHMPSEVEYTQLTKS